MKLSLLYFDSPSYFWNIRYWTIFIREFIEWLCYIPDIFEIIIALWSFTVYLIIIKIDPNKSSSYLYIIRNLPQALYHLKAVLSCPDIDFCLLPCFKEILQGFVISVSRWGKKKATYFYFSMSNKKVCLAFYLFRRILDLTRNY